MVVPSGCPYVGCEFGGIAWRSCVCKPCLFPLLILPGMVIILRGNINNYGGIDAMNEIPINAPILWLLDTPGHSGWGRTARVGDPKMYFMVSTDSHAYEPPDLCEL